MHKLNFKSASVYHSSLTVVHCIVIYILNFTLQFDCILYNSSIVLSLCIVHCTICVVYCHFVLYPVQFVLYCHFLLFTHAVQCAMYSTVFIVSSTMCKVQYSFIVHYKWVAYSTDFIVRCTMCSIMHRFSCTLYNVHAV